MCWGNFIWNFQKIRCNKNGFEAFLIPSILGGKKGGDRLLLFLLFGLDLALVSAHACVCVSVCVGVCLCVGPVGRSRGVVGLGWLGPPPSRVA